MPIRLSGRAVQHLKTITQPSKAQFIITMSPFSYETRNFMSWQKSNVWNNNIILLMLVYLLCTFYFNLHKAQVDRLFVALSNFIPEIIERNLCADFVYERKWK